MSQARDRLQAQALAVENLNGRLHEQLEEVSRRRVEAETANASKTRFLAAASHDLRQPMHSIGLLVSLLGDQVRDPALQALASKVTQSVSAMEALFSSLLDISKLDSGIVDPAIEVFDVSAVLRQIERTWAPDASYRNLRFKVRAARVLVRSDPLMLEQILSNLVSNALRYTARGGVLVGCRRKGNDLAIEVIDTGPGIPAEHLDDIFDEFVRLGTASTHEANGLGLGLSIVKRSAEILGHRVAVRSQLGKGSVFRVLVPFVAPAAHELLEQAPHDESANSVAGAFLLIVDDDEDSRRSLDALCQHWGCIVAAAASADEAVNLLGHHLRSPDVIIVDHDLGPGDDGLTCIAHLRAACAEEIPAIVVSGDLDTGLSLRASQLDARLMHKPAGPAKLRAAVAGLLAARTQVD